MQRGSQICCPLTHLWYHPPPPNSAETVRTMPATSCSHKPNPQPPAMWERRGELKPLCPQPTCFSGGLLTDIWDFHLFQALVKERRANLARRIFSRNLIKHLHLCQREIGCFFRSSRDTDNRLSMFFLDTIMPQIYFLEGLSAKQTASSYT